MPRSSLTFLFLVQFALSSCCLTNGSLFSGFGRGGSSSGSSGSSGGSSSKPGSGGQSAGPTAVPGSRPVSGGSSGGTSTGTGSSTGTSGAVSGRPTQPIQIPIPNLTITPIPIGIPIPIPIPVPVGFPIPVPDVHPTAFSSGGSSTPQPVVTASPGGSGPQTRLFEISSVTVTRTKELNYRVTVAGKGFGVLESYQFLQARIGPYAVNMVENGQYKADQAEARDLALGDLELRFIWSPATGGPTASDKFQLVFQPKGVNQVFQTAELPITLTSE
ncbi:MAG TPA: hypothetical protein V6D23_12550 [Candidatus Obscuribacterales bacterium]